MRDAVRRGRRRPVLPQHRQRHPDLVIVAKDTYDVPLDDGNVHVIGRATDGDGYTAPKPMLGIRLGDDTWFQSVHGANNTNNRGDTLNRIEAAREDAQQPGDLNWAAPLAAYQPQGPKQPLTTVTIPTQQHTRCSETESLNMVDIARQDRQDLGQADDAQSWPDGRTRGTIPPGRGGGLQHGRWRAATPHRRGGQRRHRALGDRRAQPSQRRAPLSATHLVAALPRVRPGAATAAGSTASRTTTDSSKISGERTSQDSGASRV